jgi:hypothetical protein
VSLVRPASRARVPSGGLLECCRVLRGGDRRACRARVWLAEHGQGKRRTATKASELPRAPRSGAAAAPAAAECARRPPRRELRASAERSGRAAGADARSRRRARGYTIVAANADRLCRECAWYPTHWRALT